MARKSRNIVADFPFHVIVRGNNRQPIFLDDRDRLDYKSILQAACADHGLAIHAYVLMPGEVHLIGTPSRPESFGLAMQAVGRRYVRRFNRRHGRSGTLWEGRYRASIIQEDRYLLPSLRYLELEPLRAGLVDKPEGYPWSSHRHHLGLVADPLVSPHPVYWALGNTPFDREAAYLRLFDAEPSVDEGILAEALKRGHALAEPGFLDRLEADTGRPWVRRPVGRPRRTVGS
ncbi:MAG: transposase [Lautropia sp.]|nr:transposase [Lautropia sp.]